jgi:peptide/nickel transport system permease protein
MILGGDQLGRDMFSRIIYGARNTVGIALLTTAIAFTIGTMPGLVRRPRGGWVDQILGRVVDTLLAIPQLIFALLLLTIVGTNVVNLTLVIALLYSPLVFRLARAVAGNIVVMDYIEAAKLRGESTWYLITKEILPNATAPLVAEFGLRFCFVFLAIAALSFLGLGIQPPTADWGSMVRDNATMISFGEITPLIPAAAIALLTVARSTSWSTGCCTSLRPEGVILGDPFHGCDGKEKERSSRDQGSQDRGLLRRGKWMEIVHGIDLTLHRARSWA